MPTLSIHKSLKRSSAVPAGEPCRDPIDLAIRHTGRARLYCHAARSWSITIEEQLERRRVQPLNDGARTLLLDMVRHALREARLAEAMFLAVLEDLEGRR